MSIRNRIIYGYALALGVAFLGTATGMLLGDHYQRQALRARQIASGERQLLGNLQVGILYNRPVKQLSPHLQNPQTFHRESNRFIERVEKIRSQLTTYNDGEQSTTPAQLKPLLTEYELTVDKFLATFRLFQQQTQPLTRRTDQKSEAQKLLLDLVQSPDFVKFIEFPDQIVEFYQLAEDQEKKAEQALQDAELLRIQIIVASLGLSMAIAIWLAFTISRQIARPLESLSNLAEKISRESNFDLQIPLTSQAEVAQLTTSLNQLLRQVKQLLAQQTDITLQLKLAKEQAEAASTAKSVFLTHISHELRTPLNSILGYAQILQRDANLNPTQKNNANIIERSGNHLLALINDFLDLAKIEAGKTELLPQEFLFTPFLQNILEICTIKARQKQLDFLYTPLTPLPAAIYTDEKRLRQVLINLIGNAIKFTQRGKVSLCVSIEAVDAKQVRIRFEIEDTGIGMSSEQLSHLFQPFAQVNTYNFPGQGSGLGLAISQNIVHLMGGEIQVKSIPHQGSIFWFDLECPASMTSFTNQREHPSIQAIVGYEGEKRKILVVDDSEESRSLLVMLLESWGFVVTARENGREGIVAALNWHPDLIILDLMMPDLDGLEMARHLRSHDLFEKIPLIASSASVFDYNRQQSQAAGCDDFLPKPLQIEDLLALLQSHLGLVWIQARNLHPVSSLEDRNWIVPPKATLDSLSQSALEANITKIEQQLEQICQLEPRYQAFSQKVLELAHNYEFEVMIKLLKNSHQFNS
jgi:signal transduction histidine kinase/DNA-binding response OmpR family regulator